MDHPTHPHPPHSPHSPHSPPPHPQDPHDLHLRRLRGWRNPATPDLSLAFLTAHVKRRHVKPAAQLQPVLDLWTAHVPKPLIDRTALAAFSRGVLTVHVDDSASLYQLDRLLRAGLEFQLRRAAKTTLRSIRLKLNPVPIQRSEIRDQRSEIRGQM